MTRINLALNEDEAEDLRGMAALLIEVSTRPQDVAELSDEVVENLTSVSPGVLLAVSDLGATMMLLGQRQIAERGGPDAVKAAAVEAGQAEWADAPAEA